MGEDKFDVIIVGGGLAGLTAGIVLAEQGLEVLLIERGDYCGSKNVTGGRLYGHSLEKVIPGFAEEAPIERVIKKERISLMTEDTSVDIGITSKKFSTEPENTSYSVLRAKFDRWLEGKAEEAGVMLVQGIRVDHVLTDEDGKVIGIDAAEEEMYADCVILADGVNSLLAQELGMKKELEPDQVAVGAKEVIKLGEEVINERFGVQSGEGVAWMAAGDPTAGGFGGGFLYTNKDSVSIGVVATLSDIGYSDISVPNLVDRFKEHPAIAPLLEGGETEEYAAHLVSEDGIYMVPELYRDGVLVVGDAAGLVVNLGFTVRGMDFAIESGRLAAETILKAHEMRDYSAKMLSAYEKALEDSFVFRDMRAYKGFPALTANRMIYKNLPETADEIVTKLFTVDGKQDPDLVSFLLQSLLGMASPAQLLGLAGTALESL
jgi:electron transfer flavoprotein-quinone oxidoreductase